MTVVVLVVAAIGTLAYRGHGLDTTSKQYVDTAVPAIAASWDEQTLPDRATPDLRSPCCVAGGG